MNNIYNKFRGVEKLALSNSLSKRFDEPTYFSFRLDFSDRGDYMYNQADNVANYDIMPHPLFSIDEGERKTLSNVNMYSAIRYLVDANEPTRAAMLREFISKFNDLQNGYQYYFQQIDGVQELLKIDPTKGQRIGNDKKISITCLEGLDLRMSYLMNLYKKIVWDDIYQRWILPDMMRYFTLKVYLAEFRTFHTPNNQDGYGNSLTPIQSANIPSTRLNPDQLKMPKAYSPVSQLQEYPSISKEAPMYLKILDRVLPTWEITCEMCEFDLTDITFEHLNGLNVAGDPQQGAIKFGIKVGNIKELQTYPVFEQTYLSDRKLNGVNRSSDEISTSADANNRYIYPASLQVAQNREAGNEFNQHMSGAPYQENTNEIDKIKDAKFPVKAAPSNSNATSKDQPIFDPKTGVSDKRANATDPETWVGNALDFGTSFAKGFINKTVDKAKMMQIPKLGVSFTEIVTALESKNIMSVLGLIRKGVNETAKQYGNAPSQQLEQPLITDNIMRAFMIELTKSEATDGDTLALQKAANLALSDKGVWEQIKDYSMATDLVGILPSDTTQKGEINIPNPIKGTGAFKEIIDKEGNFKPTLQAGQIIEAPSTSSFNPLIGDALTQPQISQATHNIIQS